MAEEEVAEEEVAEEEEAVQLAAGVLYGRRGRQLSPPRRDKQKKNPKIKNNK